MPFRRDKDKDTVNRRELRIALNERVSGRSAMSGKYSIAFDGFHSAAALTDSVVDDIILNRPAPGEFKTELGPSEMAETITQAELADALSDLGWGSPTINAATMFRRVSDRREPQWKVGQVVRDARGQIWKRQDRRQWTSLGTGQWFGDQQPERPLTPIEGS